MNESFSEITIKTNVLIVHPILVPYRTDFFNAVAKTSDLELALLIKNSDIDYFDEKELSSQLLVKPIFLRRMKLLMGKGFPLGLSKLLKNKHIVITTEFSLSTFYVAFFNIIFGFKFKHVIWTDDNVELIKTDRLHRRLSRWLLSRVISGWIFISDEVKEMYFKDFNISSPSLVAPIIHNDLNYRKKLDESDMYIHGLLDQYDLNGKRILLFVGRLMEEKRVDVLLRAYSKVIQEIDDTVLVIVGSGYKKESLESLAVQLGIRSSVKFVGKFEGVELAAWYRIADVFALTSYYEPFGVVVNEALIAGVTVVVTENVGSRFLVVEGINGSVVCFGDQDELVKKLVFWLKKSVLRTDKKLRQNLMVIDFSSITNQLDDFINLLSKQ